MEGKYFEVSLVNIQTHSRNCFTKEKYHRIFSPIYSLDLHSWELVGEEREGHVAYLPAVCHGYWLQIQEVELQLANATFLILILITIREYFSHSDTQ